MSKSFILTMIAILAAGLVWIGCGSKDENKSEHQMHDHSMSMDKQGEATVIYYTCPMKEHSKVGSKEPGKCPECQMDLVAAVEGTPDDHDFYGCPMAAHSHIRSDKPGVCADCGMEYKPIKLIEVKAEM